MLCEVSFKNLKILHTKCFDYQLNFHSPPRIEIDVRPGNAIWWRHDLHVCRGPREKTGEQGFSNTLLQRIQFWIRLLRIWLQEVLGPDFQHFHQQFRDNAMEFERHNDPFPDVDTMNGFPILKRWRWKHKRNWRIWSTCKSSIQNFRVKISAHHRNRMFDSLQISKVFGLDVLQPWPILEPRFGAGRTEFRDLRRNSSDEPTRREIIPFIVLSWNITWSCQMFFLFPCASTNCYWGWNKKKLNKPTCLPP